MKNLVVFLFIINLYGCYQEISLNNPYINPDNLARRGNLTPFHNSAGFLLTRNTETGAYIVTRAREGASDITLYAKGKIFYDVAISPDDQRIAFCFMDIQNIGRSVIGVFDIVEQNLQTIASGTGVHASPSFSPCGQKIIFCFFKDKTDCEIYSYLRKSSKLEKVLESNLFIDDVIPIDNDRILFWRANKWTGNISSNTWHYWELCLYDEKRRIEVVTEPFYNMPNFAMSRDGSYLVGTMNTYQQEGFMIDFDKANLNMPLIITVSDDCSYRRDNGFGKVTISHCGSYIGLTMPDRKDDNRFKKDLYRINRSNLIATKITNIGDDIEELCFSYNGNCIVYTISTNLDDIFQVNLIDLATQTYHFNDSDNVQVIDITSLLNI